MELAGARVTVMGLGLFGGGVGVSRWLARQGADVLVTDLADAQRLDAAIEQLRDFIEAGAITLRLGEHNVSDFTTPDMVVVNPAAPKPWENRFLRAAQAAGVPLTTEIRLLVERLPSRDRTIGVTGSAGKSTTAAMIAHVLRSLPPGQTGGANVHLGGNIGGSLLDRLDSIRTQDWVVLELSSFMLHWLDALGGWAPHVAVVTNMAPNHLDWHASPEHYERAKQTILRRQREGDVFVRLADAHELEHWDTLTPGRIVRTPGWHSSPSCEDIERHSPPSCDPPPRLLTPGAHNLRNAALAVEAACAALRDGEPTPPDDDLRRLCAQALEIFPGLPHRLQFVGESDAGVRFYNDSKCTTPEAVVQGVEAVEEVLDTARRAVPPSQSGGTGLRPVSSDTAQRAVPPDRTVQRVVPPAPGIHLIVGGYDKGLDLSPIAGLAPRLAGLYTIGAVGPTIASLARAQAGDHAQRVIECCDLATAMEAIAERVRPGDAVLLSPGCASWDQFRHFEERGEAFMELSRRQH